MGKHDVTLTTFASAPLELASFLASACVKCLSGENCKFGDDPFVTSRDIAQKRVRGGGAKRHPVNRADHTIAFLMPSAVFRYAESQCISDNMTCQKRTN